MERDLAEDEAKDDLMSNIEELHYGRKLMKRIVWAAEIYGFVVGAELSEPVRVISEARL